MEGWIEGVARFCIPQHLLVRTEAEEWWNFKFRFLEIRNVCTRGGSSQAGSPLLAFRSPGPAAGREWSWNPSGWVSEAGREGQGCPGLGSSSRKAALGSAVSFAGEFPLGAAAGTGWRLSLSSLGSVLRLDRSLGALLAWDGELGSSGALSVPQRQSSSHRGREGKPSDTQQCRSGDDFSPRQRGANTRSCRDALGRLRVQPQPLLPT